MDFQRLKGDVDTCEFSMIKKARGDDPWLSGTVANPWTGLGDAERCPVCGLYITLRKPLFPLRLDLEWLTDTIPEIGFDGDVLLLSPRMWERILDASPAPLESHEFSVASLKNITPAGRVRKVHDHGLLRHLESYRCYFPPIGPSYADDEASGFKRVLRNPCHWCGGGDIDELKGTLVIRRPASDRSVLFRARRAAPYQIIANRLLDWVTPRHRLGVIATPVRCITENA